MLIKDDNKFLRKHSKVKGQKESLRLIPIGMSVLSDCPYTKLGGLGSTNDSYHMN